MPYICNDCTTVSTGLQSIPIFASFPRTKPVLHPAISSVIHLLQGVKLPHSLIIVLLRARFEKFFLFGHAMLR
jgi:hypothetical protein